MGEAFLCWIVTLDLHDEKNQVTFRQPGYPRKSNISVETTGQCQISIGPVAFRPHLTVGLALSA